MQLNDEFVTTTGVDCNELSATDEIFYFEHDPRGWRLIILLRSGKVLGFSGVPEWEYETIRMMGCGRSRDNYLRNHIARYYNCQRHELDQR